MSHTRTVRPYPTSFSLGDLDALREFILSHERQVFLRDFARGDRDTAAISVRHDIDHSAVKAVEFAGWESSHGIKASYFLLPTASYYPLEARAAAVTIQSLGHEVGIHNDSYTAAKGNDDLAIGLLKGWADEMRSWGIDVSGCADHGGGEPNNTLLWREKFRLPSEAGLEYEAYLLHQQNSHYISDNRGKMNGELQDREGRQTHLLVHPCHWKLP